MKQILLEKAFVLHRRPYRETSFLVELFTPNHGRFTTIAKGVRNSRQISAGLLQPFIPLVISCAGKSELLTLSQIETHEEWQRLQGNGLFAGFYLNELLMHLLQKWDTHPLLFQMYQQSLQALQAPRLEEKILRIFEKCLLEELGYGLFSKNNQQLEQQFNPDHQYFFTPEHGFVLTDAKASAATFLGKNLLKIAREDWDDLQCLRDAKRLMRIVLAPLLGQRQLYSRQLFIAERED